MPTQWLDQDRPPRGELEAIESAWWQVAAVGGVAGATAAIVLIVIALAVGWFL
jgi:hypothetical protein